MQQRLSDTATNVINNCNIKQALGKRKGASVCNDISKGGFFGKGLLKTPDGTGGVMCFGVFFNLLIDK